MRRTAILSVAILCALASLSACRARPERPVVVKGPAFIYHTVKYPGETLATISRWYTGRESKWKLIHTYNPEADPKSLQLGQRLRIPTQYVIRKTPMPPEFASRHTRKTKQKPRAPKLAAEASFILQPDNAQGSVPGEVEPLDLIQKEAVDQPEADKNKLRDQLIENLLK